MSTDIERLDLLDNSIQRDFPQVVLFGADMDEVKVLLTHMEEKAALEDKLGLIKSGVPLTEKATRLRNIVLEGVRKYITSGNKNDLFQVLIGGAIQEGMA